MSEGGDPVDVRVVPEGKEERAERGVTIEIPERAGERTKDERELVFDVRNVSAYYGDFRAVRDVTLPIRQNEITALIGPSGCDLVLPDRQGDVADGAEVTVVGADVAHVEYELPLVLRALPGPFWDLDCHSPFSPLLFPLGDHPHVHRITTFAHSGSSGRWPRSSPPRWYRAGP